VSLINSKLLKIKEPKINNLTSVNLKTINGERKTNGMTRLKIKIFNIEKYMNVFIVDDKNFKYEFLIGLDCIKEFRLTQNEELIIKQKKNNTANIPDFPGNSEENIRQINFNEHCDINNFEISIKHLNCDQ